MSYSNGPQIVTNGLVLYLDAGNTKSYPGSGTVWNDLSGNGNNGTLVNGPSYISNNKGYFSFDGINDYINIGEAANLFPGPSINRTIESFILPSTLNTQQVYIGLQNPAGQRLYVGNYNGLWDFGFGDLVWNTGFTGSRLSVQPKFTHICLSITSGVAKLFVNAIETITKTDTSVNISSFFPIGSYFNQNNRDGTFSNICGISMVKIYNRPLNILEISQNYKAAKGRYNL